MKFKGQQTVQSGAELGVPHSAQCSLGSQVSGSSAADGSSTLKLNYSTNSNLI